MADIPKDMRPALLRTIEEVLAMPGCDVEIERGVHWTDIEHDYRTADYDGSWTITIRVPRQVRIHPSG